MEKLKAHKAYFEVSDIDLENDTGGHRYIDELEERHDTVCYSNFLYEDAVAARSTEAKRVQEKVERTLDREEG